LLYIESIVFNHADLYYFYNANSKFISESP